MALLLMRCFLTESKEAKDMGIEKYSELPGGFFQRFPGATKEEWTCFVLRGLISYHERMTMGKYPELDGWVDALRFALECVEEKMKT